MTQRERADQVRSVKAWAGAGFILAVTLFVTHALFPPANPDIYLYPLPQIVLGVVCALVYVLVD